MPAVFISYSRQDKDFVARLHEALSAREYDVWVDWQDIPPVAEWFEEIREGVGKADGFIYVISPDSAESDVCTRELEHAASLQKRIVPLVRRDPSGAEVPEAAASLNWIFLRDGDDFDTGLEQLVGAIEKDLDHVRMHTRLGVAAGRWEKSGRPASQLLRGSELAAAEAWLVSGGGEEPAPTPLQRRYVLAGRQASTRRQRTVIAGVTVALAVTAVLAVVALVERSSAIHARNVADAGRLDAEAAAQYPTDPELSVLLADRASTVDPGSATEQGLREALAQSHVRVRYVQTEPDNPGDALWSADGTRLLVTDPGYWAWIYRPESGAPPVKLASEPASHMQSAWDAKGDRVVFGGGRPGVYDAHTGRLVARLPGPALFVALSGDGTRAVTVDLQAVGHVYDVASGRQIASFTPRYRGSATCLALSPDGEVVAQCDLKTLNFGNSPGALDTWDARTGRLLHSIQTAGVIGTVAFSPHGSRYVFTTTGSIAGPNASGTELARNEGQPGTFVYDTISGRRVIAFPGAASAAVFSPVAQYPTVAYATVDAVGHIYEFLNGVNLPLTGATDAINSLSFNASGTEVVTASRDGVARVYNAGEGGQPIEVLAGHKGEVTSASFGLDGTAIATTSKDGTTRVWASPVPRPTRLRALSAPTATIAFTPDNRRLLQASLDGQGELLDARTLKLLTSFHAPAGEGFAGAGVGRGGSVIATLTGPLTRAGGLSSVTGARLYDAASGRAIATLTPRTPGALADGVLNEGGTRLVTTGIGGSSDVWDTRTGRLLYHLPQSRAASGAAFSHDGTLLAIAHYPTLPRTVNDATKWGPITVDLYDARSGRHLRTIAGRALMPQVVDTMMYAPLTVAFSPNGRLLAVAGAAEGIDLFDQATGRVVRSLGIAGAPAGSYVASLAFSPNGRLLAAGAANGAYVWRLPSYAPFPTALLQVPAGATPASVGNGNGVTVAFTDDSRYLVTTGDLAVEAWSLDDQLRVFDDTPAFRGTMSHDGRELAAVGLNGAGLYPCELCGGLAHLRALAGRDTTRKLTRGERAAYLSR